MAASYGKGPKGKATRLHAELVRARGECQAVGQPWHRQCSAQLQCSHFVSRGINATRVDLDNALCLCAACHRHVGNNPHHHYRLFTEVFGDDMPDVLDRRRAQRSGNTRYWEGFFADQVNQLQALKEGTDEHPTGR